MDNIVTTCLTLCYPPFAAKTGLTHQSTDTVRTPEGALWYLAPRC